MALSGNCCWDMLKDLSSNAVRLKIAGIHPPNPNSGEDRIVWGLPNNDYLTTKSAYNFLLGTIQMKKVYFVT
jgi:hypothetical protein